MPNHKPKESQSAQSKRFIETAKALGADPNPEAFDRIMRKVDLRPAKKAAPAPQRRRKK